MRSHGAAKPSNLPGLTGLRGVGAVWVVCYHASIGLGVPVAQVGYLGVDLFFILSGFVLSHAHPDADWTWSTYRRFIQSRFARIFPLHWACLALLVAVVALDPAIPTQMPSKFRWPDLVSSAFLVQSWGVGPTTPWNVPSWSLSTEWLVSLVFPGFLLAARRVRPTLAPLVCGACLTVFAGFLVLTDNPVPDVTARAGVVRTVCEFATGCLLYRVHASGFSPGRVAAAAAAALIGLGVAVPGWAMLAVFGMPVLILMAARPASRVVQALATKPMLFLGKVSFSIYLLHWTLLQVSERAAAQAQVHGPTAVLWFCCFLALVVALSALTYAAIEVRARAWLRP